MTEGEGGEGRKANVEVRGRISGKRYLLNNVRGASAARRRWANSIKCTHVNPRFRFKRFRGSAPPVRRDPPFLRDNLRKLGPEIRNVSAFSDSLPRAAYRKLSQIVAINTGDQLVISEINWLTFFFRGHSYYVIRCNFFFYERKFYG